MATTVKVQDLTALGAIAVGDKFPGERVAGQTRLITYTPAVMTGTVDQITVVNGDAVSGPPTFSIATTYVGQTSLTTLGTITTGTWNASVISVTYGGTGVATNTAYGVLVGGTTGTSPIQSVTPGAANTFLLSGGASAVPIWSTSTVPTSAGATANKILKSDGTNYVLSTATFSDSPGTAGGLLQSDGTNWITSTPKYANTYAVSTILYNSSANTVVGLATANNGVLVTNGTGVPSISTDIPTAVTVGGQYNYRAGGTDIPVTDGGTGLSTMTTAYAPVCAGTTATGNLQVASTGLSTSGYVLTSNGASALPSFQAAPAGTEVTQAEQEAATNTTAYVSAAKQKFHPSSTKAWVYVGIAGNIQASYNVSSVTDTGTGDALVNFTVSFSSVSFAATVSLSYASAADVGYSSTRAVGSCRIVCIDAVSGVNVDPAGYDASFFGDQ